MIDQAARKRGAWCFTKQVTLFGTVRTPGRPERFTYLLLFRYRAPRVGDPPTGVDPHCTAHRHRVDVADVLIADRRVEVGYRVEPDQEPSTYAIAINVFVHSPNEVTVQ